jgi:asparagine synthase (glutamine-hydrolysing)
VAGDDPAPVSYWSLRQVAEQGLAAPFRGSEPEAVEHLDSLLRQVVRGQMIADVPLGAFLSGGVDSSTIVALMQAQSTQPVKTFTIGFHESIYNEAVYAKAVAEHLGTDHTEMYVTPDDALAVIPRLPTLYDEPFGDASQIPTFLVSELARRHVTVSLSGDGGDELFAGYTRYREANTLWKKMGWVAPEHRYALARLLDTNKAIAKGAVEVATRLYGTYRPSAQQQQGQKIQQVLQCSRIEHLYRLFFMTYWRNAPNLVLKSSSLPTVLSDSHQWMQQADPLHRMMYLDSLSYLPDDILVKVDRAAMGVSLETRVPLLDHRVVEQVWQLPLSMKVRQQQSKWLLRQLLYQYVPRNLIERPKTGFGVPLDTWLRGPLRDWAEALLDPQRVRDEGFFDTEPIQKTWQEHLEGRRDWQYYLWNVLMFQAWREAR